jgi:3-hydroxyacyl-[acyl-carrier-protein] dehydratase
MTRKALIEREALLAMLPHRPPFLFVDRVLEYEPGQRIVAERRLRPEEPHFAGHFPGRALMPGVLVTEALAQTSGLFLGLSAPAARPVSPGVATEYVLAATNMKFKHPAAPGDLLCLIACPDTCLAGLFRFNVDAWVERTLIATGSLTLAQLGRETAHATALVSPPSTTMV